ncbi:MAG: endonuclease/exonuclease/phosphatase family protein [Streptomyces sp.]|uniref:endonuclease/exonuclease/phosphatase family protein n=1 Tax=Streptomyces sp. TaxID=1931 RepID=UPI003D6A7C38
MEGVIRRVAISPSAAAAIVAVMLAGGLLIAYAVSPRPESSADSYVIGQFNMAGGTTEHGTKGNAPADALAAEVKGRKAALITLQESCRDWDARLRDRLPGYTVLFGPVDNLDESRSTARCRHPTDFGNTLVFRDDLGFDEDTAASHLLGSTVGDEYREMICVRSESRKLVACSAHLTPGAGEFLGSRLREAAEAGRILATRYKGYTAILGGDINDLPASDTLDSFYHRDYRRGADGALKEAAGPCGDSMRPERRSCRSGEQTHAKGKIDYLFVSPSVRVEWSGVAHSEHSDHRPLWARVVF